MAVQLYTILKRSDTEEYHIFNSDFDALSGECTFSQNSICNKMDKSQNVQTGSTCKDEYFTRIKAAEIGRRVCGICVSNLYTTYK